MIFRRISVGNKEETMILYYRLLSNHQLTKKNSINIIFTIKRDALFMDLD